MLPSVNSPPVIRLCILFLSLPRVLHLFWSPSPATEISNGYSSTGSDTAPHYLVALPSQEGCASDGCKAKESVIKISGELYSSQSPEKKSFLRSVFLCCCVLLTLWTRFVLVQQAVVQLRVSCILITVSEVQFKLKIMYTISTIYYSLPCAHHWMSCSVAVMC